MLDDDKAPIGSSGRSALKSPEEWRAERITEQRDAWKHACAAAAHGWQEHAYHEGKPLQLTAADYDAALAAAADGKLHERAASKHLARVAKENSK
jgi:hypothetical protein